MAGSLRSFSIVITNYNYAPFLAEAIESALNQTVPAEVIVIDDGSTDNSRTIIANYGDRIHAVFQENGGQASAYNAGFGVCHGDLILFLDSDDVLDHGLVEQVLSHADDETAKVHFPLRVINREGVEMGGVVPSEELSSGDLGEGVLRDGYYSSPPSSGNVYARRVLDQILPIEQTMKYNADTYTVYLAPFFGKVVAINTPLGGYRLHGGNHDLASFTNEASVADALRRDVARVNLLESVASKRGLSFNNQCLLKDVHHIKLRISSLRLAPDRHSFQADSRFLLLMQGLKATWGTRYLSLRRKLLFSGWFAALASAPSLMVPKLAAIGCSPAARATSVSWLLSKSKS